jgi:hypothetical protein
VIDRIPLLSSLAFAASEIIRRRNISSTDSVFHQGKVAFLAVSILPSSERRRPGGLTNRFATILPA